MVWQRSSRGLVWLDDLRRDVRHAFRTLLLRTPGFTVVAVLTLALGIGANTAIFSVVNGVLLRPLPYADPDALVAVFWTTATNSRDSHRAADFLDLQARNRSLAAVAGYRGDAATLVFPAGDPVRVPASIVTASFFDVLGVPALLGRSFSAGDAGHGEALAVISHAAWQQEFSADPGIAGRLVRANGAGYTITGVMPPSFNFPGGVKIWLLSPKPVPTPPIDVPGDLLADRNVGYFQAIARVRPGVSAAALTEDLPLVASSITERSAGGAPRPGLTAVPLRDSLVGDVRAALFVLFGAVGVVLLIACANVASLLLARTSGRQRELAIRASLGAGRGRLIRQLLTENLVLGAGGGVAGLFVGVWAVGLLVSVMPDGIPRVEEIALDWRVAAAALGMTLLSVMFFGLVPALQASRTNAAVSLKEAGVRGGGARARTRAALVVAEVALTLVLLVSAGLLANSFLRLQRVDPGFLTEQVTLVSLPVPQARYPDSERQAAFYRRVLEGIADHPAIASVALVFPSPLEGTSAQGSFSIEGRPEGPGAERPLAGIASISPDYFATMGMRLVSGRGFTDADRQPAPAVAILNMAAARRYWPDEDPVGRRFRYNLRADDWITVVGVVADTRNVGLQAQPAPQVYLPFDRFTLPFMNIAVRSAAGTGVVASVARSEVAATDPELPVDRVYPLARVVAESVGEPRFRTLLLGLFAAIALVLAAVGLYGLISYSVTQRTREIGIRVALGARPRQVMLPVLREGLRLALLGMGLGLAGALVATRALAVFLFGVGTTDPLTFAAVSGLLLGVALLASYIPARRALRVDPVTALRAE
jgi:putative ABC transport system permease protein